VTAWNNAELSILIETIDEWPNKRPRVLREISTKTKDFMPRGVFVRDFA
jgi:hypothetical protein